MMRAHWTPRDFRPVSQPHIETHAADGSPAFYAIQKGVCAKCGCDMQRFAYSSDSFGQPLWARPRHYSSHRNSR